MPRPSRKPRRQPSSGFAATKSAEPGAHKTETGGIAPGLTSEDEVREAAARIGLSVVAAHAQAAREPRWRLYRIPYSTPRRVRAGEARFAELIGTGGFPGSRRSRTPMPTSSSRAARPEGSCGLPRQARVDKGAPTDRSIDFCASVTTCTRSRVDLNLRIASWVVWPWTQWSAFGAAPS